MRTIQLWAGLMGVVGEVAGGARASDYPWECWEVAQTKTEYRLNFSEDDGMPA